MNKFYLDKRTCATTVLNSMIKDCNTPKSGHRHVQYMKKKLHLRADHDQVKNTWHTVYVLINFIQVMTSMKKIHDIDTQQTFCKCVQQYAAFKS